MSDEPSDLFAGLSFYIDVGPECSNVVKVLRDLIVKHQGEVAESLGQPVNHVVLRHQQQPVFAAARALPGVALVQPTWVWECVQQQRLQPYDNQGPYPAAAIPGAEAVTTSMTGIKGAARTFIVYQVQAMGASYSGHFSPVQQTTLLVPVPKKPSDCSDKVAVALKNKTNLLHYDWVKACLAAWTLVPIEPYNLKGQYSAMAQAPAAGGTAQAPTPPAAGAARTSAAAGAPAAAAEAEVRTQPSAGATTPDSLTPAAAAGRLQSPPSSNWPGRVAAPAAAGALDVPVQGQHAQQQQQAGSSSVQGWHNPPTVQQQGAAEGMLGVGMSSAMASLLAPLMPPAAGAVQVPAMGPVTAAPGANNMPSGGVYAAAGHEPGQDLHHGIAPDAANAVPSPGGGGAAAAAAAPDEEQGTPFGTADDAAFAVQISVSQQLESLLEEQHQEQGYQPGLDQVAEEGEEEQEEDVTEATDGTQSTQATEVTEIATQEISQMEVAADQEEVLQPLLPGGSRPLADVAHAAAAAAAGSPPATAVPYTAQPSTSAAAAATAAALVPGPAGAAEGGLELPVAPEGAGAAAGGASPGGELVPAASSDEAQPDTAGSSQGHKQSQDPQQDNPPAAAAAPAAQEEPATSQQQGAGTAAVDQTAGGRSSPAGQLVPAGVTMESLNLSASLESGVAPDVFLRNFVGGLPWAATQLPEHQPLGAPGPAVAAAAGPPGMPPAGEQQQQQAGLSDAPRLSDRHHSSSMKSPAGAAPPTASGSNMAAAAPEGSGAGSASSRLSGLQAAGRYRGPGLSRRGRSSVISMATGPASTPAAAAGHPSPDADPTPTAAAGEAADGFVADEAAAMPAAAAVDDVDDVCEEDVADAANVDVADGIQDVCDDAAAADAGAAEGLLPAADTQEEEVVEEEGVQQQQLQQEEEEQEEEGEQQQQKVAAPRKGRGAASRGRGRRGAKAAGATSAAGPEADTTDAAAADDTVVTSSRGRGRGKARGDRGGGRGRGRRGGKAGQTTPVSVLDLSAPNGLPEWLQSPAAAPAASAAGDGAASGGAGLLAALQQQGVQPQVLYGSPEHLRGSAAAPAVTTSTAEGAAAAAAALTAEPGVPVGCTAAAAALPTPPVPPVLPAPAAAATAQADPSPAPLQVRVAAAKAAAAAAAAGGKPGARRSRSASPAAGGKAAAQPSLAASSRRGPPSKRTGKPQQHTNSDAVCDTSAAEVPLQHGEAQQQVLVPLQSAAALPPAGSRKRGRGGAARRAGPGAENQPPTDPADQEDVLDAGCKAGKRRSAPAAAAAALAEATSEAAAAAAAVQAQEDAEAAGAAGQLQDESAAEPAAVRRTTQRKRSRPADADAQQQGAPSVDIAAAAAQSTHSKQQQPRSKVRKQQQHVQQQEDLEGGDEEEQQTSKPAAGGRSRRQQQQEQQQQQQLKRSRQSTAAATSSRSAGSRGNRSGTGGAAAAAPSPPSARAASSRGTGSLGDTPGAAAASGSASGLGSGNSSGKAGIKVTLRGMHTEERQRWAKLLKKLKVRYQAEEHTFCPNTTHIVSPQLKRAEKTLCGMAAGAWLLGETWLEACDAAGGLVEEEEHELQECWDADVISPGAPACWRERAQQLQQGAFQGLTVLLYRPSKASSSKAPAAGPEVPLDTISRTVAAGGGQVLASKPPFSQQLLQGAAKPLVVVVWGDVNSTTDRNIAAAVAAGVPCVSPAYIVDWLAHPSRSLAGHYQHGTAAPVELLQLEMERGQHGRGAGGADAQPEVSVSF